MTEHGAGGARCARWYPWGVKYRHHGYKDDEHDKERRAPAAPKKREDDGMPRPSRLAEKRISTLVFRCHNCGRQVVAPESVGAAEACPG